MFVKLLKHSMNKNILPILLMLLACACKDAAKSTDGEKTTSKHEQDTCNWLNFDYKVANAFLINDPEGYLEAFSANKPFDKYIKADSVWILDSTQVNKLNDILCGRMMSKENSDEAVAACFEPHHGVLFYDKTNKIVASINICFLCNNAQISPPAKLHDMKALGQWCEDIGMPR